VLIKSNSITLTQGGFDKLNHRGVGFRLLPKGGFDKLNHRGIGFQLLPQGGFDRLNHRGGNISLTLGIKEPQRGLEIRCKICRRRT
jgi:hypothetical protein